MSAHRARKAMAAAELPGVGRHRQALRAHPLERAGVRDRRREERRVVAVQRLDERPVHRLAPVEHRHERQHPRRVRRGGRGRRRAGRACAPTAGSGWSARPARRPPRTRPRSTARCPAGSRGSPRRSDRPAAASSRRRRPVECLAPSSSRSRWRSEKSAGTRCTPGTSVSRDVAGQLAALGDQPPGAALEPLLDPEGEGRRALRIEVPQQHPCHRAGRLGGEVDGGGGLADAALDAVRAPAPSRRRSLAVEQVVEGATGGRAVEVVEPLADLEAHRLTAPVVALDELTDGEQRRCRPSRSALPRRPRRAGGSRRRRRPGARRGVSCSALRRATKRLRGPAS